MTNLSHWLFIGRVTEVPDLPPLPQLIFTHWSFPQYTSNQQPPMLHFYSSIFLLLYTWLYLDGLLPTHTTAWKQKVFMLRCSTNGMELTLLQLELKQTRMLAEGLAWGGGDEYSNRVLSTCSSSNKNQQTTSSCLHLVTLDIKICFFKINLADEIPLLYYVGNSKKIKTDHILNSYNTRRGGRGSLVRRTVMWYLTNMLIFP